MTQQGWAFQCTQLFKGLKDAGRPHYLRQDPDLLKEYEDWREYVSHIEHESCVMSGFVSANIKAYCTYVPPWDHPVSFSFSLDSA